MPQLTLTDIFEECQKGIQGQGKLVNTLKKLYNSTELEIFWTDFIYHAKYSMVVYNREPVVERSIEFLAKFATSLLTKDEESDKAKASEEASEEEAEEEEMHPFLLKFFTFCLEHHNAREKAVRFRCCQLVNKLLNSMGDEAQIDDDLYDRIYECMLQRLRDKFPQVRIQAVLALARLQDPHDPDCPVINAYLFLLGCDTNPDVRRAVLGVIAASTKTLIGIVERTRDVKDTVRRLAYQIIAEKVHIRAFTIAQRVRLLHEGLNDRASIVKEACSARLLQSWLRIFEGNILELLKALDVENSLETAQLTLKTLFKKCPANDLVTNFDKLNEEHVLLVEEVTPESVLYWRCLVEHLSTQGAECEEQLDKVLPGGSDYARFMNLMLGYMAGEDNIDVQLRNEFILQQLLAIAEVLDLTDQVRRQEVQKLIRDMLLSEHVNYALAEPLIVLYTKLAVGPERRQLDGLIEIISDIRMPIVEVDTKRSEQEQRELDMKLAQVRVSLNELREELDACVTAQDFEKAASIKASISDLDHTRHELLNQQSVPDTQEVRTEKNDSRTLLKCLSISSEMLQHVSFKGLTPSLHELIHSLILPGITNADPAVRNVAVRCLGLCCLLDKPTSSKHLLLFMQVAQMDVETVKITALRVLFDILHTFGLDDFGVSADVDAKSNEGGEEADNDDASSKASEELVGDAENTEADAQTQAEKDKANRANSILTVLISLLDSQSSDLRSVAAEGLAKLMLCGRVMSPRLLSRLLLLWYNPVTEDDNHLRHCLGAFFPIYAFAGQANQQICEEAFMITLNTLFNAPATSPLAEVDANNVAELLIQLTNPNDLIHGKQDYCCHDNMAVTVCNEILREPNSFNVRLLCRMLTLLQINPNNYPVLKQLHTLTDSLLKDVKDKQCVKLVEKFDKSIRALLLAARQNPLIATTPAVVSRTESRTEGVTDAHTEETDTTETTQKGDRTSSQESELSMAVEDSFLIDPNNSKLSRKGRKGKRMLHSINETPVSQKSTRRKSNSSQDTQLTSPSQLTENSQDGSQASSESAAEPEPVAIPSADDAATAEHHTETYASPTPVRRSRRTRRTPKSTAAQSLRDTRKNMEELLSESDTQSDTGAAPEPVQRRTRASRKRPKKGGPRGPLNEIRNKEVA